MRGNSIISVKNAGGRNREVRSQIIFPGGEEKRIWETVGAETALSSIKRKFGEHVTATWFQHMVKEMALRHHCITYLED